MRRNELGGSLVIEGSVRNDDGPASMLLHFAPGAPREAYFEGNAHFAAHGRPPADELAAFYAEHDNVWVDG